MTGTCVFDANLRISVACTIKAARPHHIEQTDGAKMEEPSTGIELG
tara:strand:- start:140 stop:277 length:138 start_codon:yes stop_codon:yes gene_type:complete